MVAHRNLLGYFKGEVHILSSFDDMIKHVTENHVPDPDGNGLIDISKMNERELTNLFDQTWAKVKRIRSDHAGKHGWLLNCFTILNKLYEINLHKWGRDEGRSGESLAEFKKYLT